MNRETRSSFLNTVGLVQGSLFLVAVALGLAFGVKPWLTLSFTPAELGLSLLGVLPMFMMFYASGSLNDLVVRMFGRSLDSLTVLDIALVALLVGVGEELLFRGVLERLLGRESAMVGLVLANLAFAACHAVNRTYFVTTFFVGCYLSALMSAGDRDNLLRPIIAHTVYDFVAFLMIRREWRRRTGISEEQLADEHPTVPDPTVSNPTVADAAALP